MSRPRNAVPTYRRHKQSGQAIVTLRTADGGRHDVLLGPYDSTGSKAEYARVLAEYQVAPAVAVAPLVSHAPASWTATPTGRPDLTVAELLLAFDDHARNYFRKPDGTSTSELRDFRLSLRPLRELYGHTRSADFTPLALKAVREAMLRQPVTSRVKQVDPATGEEALVEKVLRVGLARGVVNQRIDRVKRAFAWGVSEGLVPVAVHQALATVEGLKRGRSTARETEPVGPVPDGHVDATLPFLLPPVRAMVGLQRLTGMRPGEVCRVRGID
jgi:hypothetical protein